MPQDELVDVVDEAGNKLKTVTKKEAHQLGLLHQTVISEVIDSRGRWLMVKQSSDKQDADQFVSPVGGHITSGETEEETLKREALEELGLSDFKYEYVDRAIFNRHVIGRQENHLFIIYKIYSDNKPLLNEEAESYEYFTEEELKSRFKKYPEQFGDAFHFVVKRFFPHLIS